VRRNILSPLDIGLVLDADETLPPTEAIALITRALGAGEVGEAVLRSYLPGTFFGSETTREQAESLLEGMAYALVALSPDRATERVIEYHPHVIIISEPPFYSFTEDDGYFTIIVYLADDYINALVPGDTFVFEPSAENTGGISGHVVDVYHVVGGAVITARQPLLLSEIFIQYAYAATFDLLNDQANLVPDDPESPGITVARNNNAVQVLFNQHTFDNGITLDGSLAVIQPRVYACMALTHVNYLYVTAEANFTALTLSGAPVGEDEYGYRLPESHFIPLFTVHSMYSGKWVELAVGLYVSRDGAFSLEIDAYFNTAFGIREGYTALRSYVDFDFEYAHYYTRAEVALGLEARARVLGIPVYGIHAKVGRGFTATAELQAQCHGDVCFVVGIFDIRQLHSLTRWGALSQSAALRFQADFAYEGLFDTWYIYRGTHRRFSTHPPRFALVEYEEE